MKNTETGEAPAVVALRMEEVTAWVIERVAKMPRDHKFTIGDRLVETCLSVTELLCEAAYTRDRLPLLLRASRALTRARLLVRLAQRLHLLSMNQREHFAAQTTEIGQMIGGWTRAARSRYEGPAGR
jgi:hypothetical protein